MLNTTTKNDQMIKDMSGERLVKYMGRCARCRSTLYAMPDGDGFDADPRGVLGLYHCCSWTVAKEYGMQGPDVLFCYSCHQENSDTYKECIDIAKRQWKIKEPCL